MITNALLSIITTFMNFIISILPAWSVHLPDACKSVVGFLFAFDAYLPITESVAVLTLYGGLVGVVSVVKWSIKVADYVADVLP